MTRITLVTPTDATGPELAEGWRRHARRRLETGTVEDWTSRLTGRERSD